MTVRKLTLAERVGRICAALPEVTQRPSHGAPTWFIRDKKSFVMVWPTGHHDNQFPHLWCAAPPGVQDELIKSSPERFFRPPYVGHRGWVGMRLDGKPDWDEVAEVCRDAYLTVAPAKLASLLTDESGEAATSSPHD